MEDKTRVELLDDEGCAFEVEHLLTFAHDSKHYIAFGDVSENGDEETGVYLFRIEESESEGDTYIPIENEIELEEVWSVFKDIFDEESDEDLDEE